MGECVGNFGCPSTPDQCNCTLSCSCYDGYQGAQCHQW